MRRFLRSPLLQNSTLRLAKVGFIGMTEILMPIAIRVSLRGYTTLVYSDENSGLVDDLKEGGIVKAISSKLLVEKCPIIFYVKGNEDFLQYLTHDNNTLIMINDEKDELTQNSIEKIKELKLNHCKVNAKGTFDDARSGRIDISVTSKSFMNDKINRDVYFILNSLNEAKTISGIEYKE